MIVEDERIVALNLQQRLLKLGYEVPAMAVSGEQALHFAQTLKPDLVLMDIHIQGEMDGIETAERIDQALKTPVIYLTAYSEEKTLARARITKPYGYLLKPFSERELHATIQMALERRRADIALNQSQARLSLALEAANMGHWELDSRVDQEQTLYAGQADRIFGYSQDIFNGTRDEFIQLVHPEDRAKVDEVLDKTLLQNSVCDIEFRSFQGNDGPRWLRLQGKVFKNHDENVICKIIGMVQNITERKLAESRLMQAATVFDTTQDGILILDQNRSVIAANSSFKSITGYSAEDMMGKLPYVLREAIIGKKRVQELNSSLQKDGVWRGEINALKRSGEEFPALLTIAAVKEPSLHLSHYVLVTTDLTQIRRIEEKLHYLAHHDPLTGLPNRLLTIERLNQSLLHAKRRGEHTALLFIDLDHFKWVNDSLGHDAGDTFLKQTAERMQSCVRADDTVGRLGGDEFLIIIDPIERVEDLALLARKLINSISQPITVNGHTFSVTSSIGISISPDDATNSADLIRCADMSMYEAKERGRQNYAFYSPEMTARAMKHLDLAQDLRRGLAAGELCLHYQPQISFQSGKITGFEALIRWQHSTKGLLGADSIIPLAENSGLILEIGDWVLRESCRQLGVWTRLGLPALRMAVNVSGLQMRQAQFALSVEKILQKEALLPSLLEIEITESTLQNESSCMSTLRDLNKLGVNLAVDDFGTGYSCLNSLKLLPIHRVKIDKSFVNDISSNENDVAIAEAIIAMAHRLKLQVIAEGVESADQELLLKGRGCDEAQGYLYSRALSPERVEALFVSGDAGISCAGLRKLVVH